ncbi:MAG: hypothetical protein QOG15_2353 [Solirubrobacteraceae bacterium]|jgi:hypothetical protein|nr:hypothetical protein [Solirubrobacteraceae bacterium]
MNTSRIITSSLVIAIAAIAPTAAIAKNGADDNPSVFDDHGGQTQQGSSSSSSSSSSGGASSSVVRSTGTCTGSSTAKLKAKPRDGRLETEFEVDQNKNGVKWKVRIRRNGNLAVKKSVKTKAPSGSFSVERRLTDGAGSDTITARATSPTGEVCTASLTI